MGQKEWGAVVNSKGYSNWEGTEMAMQKKKGQGWGAAGKLTDKGAKERKMLGHSHLSKDKILLLLANSHY